jgi:hypothetical protein
MAETIQLQEPEVFSSNFPGKTSRTLYRDSEQGAQPRLNQPASRRATGPRTVRGKERSKLNALKHGLFFKAVLLEGESRAEYLSFLNDLRTEFQPQGEMESVCVENLSLLLWRKRRLLQAENAEISDQIVKTEIQFKAKMRVEAFEISRSAITSGGLLKHIHNPHIVTETKETLICFRELVVSGRFTEDSRLIEKLYGEGPNEGIPYAFRTIYEVYARSASLVKTIGQMQLDPEEMEYCIKVIDAEIERLKNLEQILEATDRERSLYRSVAAFIPAQEISDRLMRYETHLSREIDKVLNRLERLQRNRTGQPLPPQLVLNVS